MSVSYALLKQKLMEVTQDSELDGLGFTERFTRLEERINDETAFERLWVTSNQEGIEIVVLDQGNSWIDVIAFLDEYMKEQKVFKPDLFGHIPSINNQDHHKEMEQNLELYLNILNPNKDNLEILALHQKEE